MLSGFAAALQLTYLVGSLTIQSYICQPPTAPNITSPADQTVITEGVAFTVSGDGPHNSTIVISDGNADLVSVQATESNQFSASVTISGTGEHTLSVKASRPCGTTQGNQITVTTIESTDPVDPIDPVDPVDPTNPPTPNEPSVPGVPSTGGPSTPDEETPPQTPLPDTNSDDQGTSKGLYLSVTDPVNGSSTTDDSVYVQGLTNNPAKITVIINGETVAQTFSAQTTFGLNVPLAVGVNDIYVTGSGEAGTAGVKLTITRYAEQSSAAEPWSSSEAGRTTIRVAAVSIVAILVLVIIIGLVIL